MEGFKDLEKIVNIFEGASSFGERLKVFRESGDITKFVEFNLTIAGDKNGDKSAEHRSRGNEGFKRGNDRLALTEYNKAVRLGSPEDDSLSVALANRSAVLFSLKQYQACLEDIDMALDLNYPHNIRYKVYERRVKCRAAMGQPHLAATDIESLKAALQESGLSEEKRLNCVDAATRLVLITDKRHTLAAGQPNGADFPGGEAEGGRNSSFPGLTSRVKMGCSEDRGRFMIATTDIQVGEMIGCERPVSCVPVAGQEEDKCDSCLATCSTAPLYCTACSTVQFCSRRCQQEAINTWHSWECGVRETVSETIRKDNIMESFPTYYRLGFRVMTKNIHISEEKSAKLIERSTCLNMAETPVQKERDFESIFNLCGAENLNSSSLDQDFWVFVMLVFYLTVLRRKGFFKPDSPSEESVALRLYVIIKILQHNCHSVMEAVVQQAGSDLGFRMEAIASAIYTSLAFLNHACDSNTIKYFEGGRVVILATRPIAAGEEVTENYGPHFSMTGKSQRQAWLQEYFGFRCGCSACTVDLPLLDHLPDRVNRVTCPACPHGGTLEAGPAGADQLVCAACGTVQPQATWQARVRDIIRCVVDVAQGELVDRDYKKSSKLFAECLTKLYSTVKQPFRSLVTTERLYWKAVRMVHGNRKVLSKQ